MNFAFAFIIHFRTITKIRLYSEIRKILFNKDELIYYILSILQKKLTPLLSIMSKDSPESRIAPIFQYNPDADSHLQSLLRHKFNTWNTQPRTFFTYQQPRIETIDTLDPQSKLILDYLQLKQDESHFQIVRRFYCIVLHRCRAIRQQAIDAKIIAQKVFPICYRNRLLKENDKDMQFLIKTIKDLINAGSRFDIIASRCGGYSSLFFLGDTVPVNV